MTNEMNSQVTSRLVERLKDEAFRRPRMPAEPIPQRHYHHFPDKLGLCFTQDVLPMGRFWHLSVARPGGPTEEDLAFWPRKFVDADPVITMPGILLRKDARHFYWRREL